MNAGQTRVIAAAYPPRLMKPVIGITAHLERVRWGVWDGIAALTPINYVQWVERARRAGLDEESINALVAATLQALFFEEAA